MLEAYNNKFRRNVDAGLKGLRLPLTPTNHCVIGLLFISQAIRLVRISDSIYANPLILLVAKISLTNLIKSWMQ